jgi:riboflavin kinase/FMN adenylyltransferase
MKVFRGIESIKRLNRPVAALGVFDGVHAGHINILRSAVREARRIRGTSLVVTFWPHPQKEKSLYSLEHRLRLISQLGIQACLVINFNSRFRRIKAEDFVKNILAGRLGVRRVFVGANFRFGKNGTGDARLLRKLSHIYNYKVRVFKVIKINNRPVSSTNIRNLIRKGSLVGAQKLLTRPVSVLGTVIKGQSLARIFGFPTANIDPHHEVTPLPGIYAVRAVYNNKIYFGACYIGSRPTFEISEGKHIEVHMFGFKRKIYGKFLEIQFVKKIRNDKKFKNLRSLACQISKDISSIRTMFRLSR